MRFFNSGKQKKGTRRTSGSHQVQGMHTREAQERTTKHSHVMILAISVAASKLHILLELRDNISDAKRAKRRVLFVCVFFLRTGNLLFFCSLTKFLVAVNLPTEERLSHQVPIPFFPGVPQFFSSNLHSTHRLFRMRVLCSELLAYFLLFAVLLTFGQED